MKTHSSTYSIIGKVKIWKKVKFHKKWFFFTCYLCKPSQKSFRFFSKWYYVKNQWHSNDIHQFQCVYSQKNMKELYNNDDICHKWHFLTLNLCRPSYKSFNFFLKWYCVKDHGNSNVTHQFQCYFYFIKYKNYIEMTNFAENDYFWPLTSLNRPINHFEFF